MSRKQGAGTEHRPLFALSAWLSLRGFSGQSDDEDPNAGERARRGWA